MSWPTAVLVFAATAALWPCPSRAQSFETGLVPQNVVVHTVPRPYAVHGDTPAALTASLRALGLGGSWTRISSFYIWHYELEEQPHLLAGTPSDACRIPRFEVDLTFTIEYPVWERPANADTVLVAAWGAFVELIERQWAERRADIYAQLTELNRIARRLEIPCGAAYTRIDALMDQISDEGRRAELRERERGERVVLQWPPPGFEDTRSASRGDASGGGFVVPSATTVEREPTDPERLLAEAQRDQEQGGGSGLLVVAGLRRAGQPVYFETVIDNPAANGAPLDPGAPRAYPGITEVFVATLAAALDSADVLDVTAPIATYLPSIDPALGRVTLRQLLSHRSGIDNARPDTVARLDWPEAARRLSSRALFTEPGAIYSYSGYNYPLAIWVLESVTGRDFPTLASSALFAPLGMASTRIGAPARGMPLTITTPADLMVFLSAWVDGGLRGAPPLTRDPSVARIAPEGERSFDAGVWYDEIGSTLRISLACGSGAFQIFPASGTAFMLWTSGRWPHGMWRYLLSDVGEQEGVREQVLQPFDAQGAGRLGAVDPTCQEPMQLKENVLMLGALTPTGDWAGRYRNGDQINQLDDRDGFLKVTNGAQPLDVSHYAGDVHFVGAGGRAFYPLRLTRDTDGRRYLVLDGRAFIHEDDRPALGAN